MVFVVTAVSGVMGVTRGSPGHAGGATQTGSHASAGTV